MKMKLSFVICLLFATAVSGFAQDFDDIYYNSSKSNKKESKKLESQNSPVYADDIAASDTYTLENNGVDRDVDEYNRRYTTQDSVQNGSFENENQSDFVYTDRIKRFYNPSVITDSSDPELAELYYASTAPSINLVIGTPTYYWDPFWYDYWHYPYSWHAGWYGPGWHRPYYAWDWNWGWTFGWGWHHPIHYPHWGHCPVYHPGHGPVIGGHHKPTYNQGSRRPIAGNSSAGSIGRRPATPSNNRGNTSVNGTSSGRRPSSVSTTTNNGKRPAVNNTTQNSNSGRRPATVRNSSSSSSSRDSYNSSSSSRSSNRSSGYSSGGSRGGFGGGSYSGGSRGSSGGGRRR